MSKSKAKRNKYSPEAFETSKPNEHYTRLYDSMLTSEAFMALTSSARSVLLILKLQFKGNYTGNTVICPYSTIQKYGLNTTTIKNALLDLSEKGFIEIEYGTLQMKGKELKRQPNKYKFIDAWKSYSREKKLIGKYKAKGDKDNTS